MILVLVDHVDGVPDRLSLEALTFARSLGEPVEAVALGPGAPGAAEAVGGHGAHRLHVAEDLGASYAPAAAGRAVTTLVRAVAPNAVVGPATDRATEALATAAALLAAPLSTNTVAVRAGDDGWEVTRQRWGGSLLEEARLDGNPRFLTVAPHAVAPQPMPESAPAEVIAFDPEVQPSDTRARLVAHEAPQAGALSLTEARVVVGGGRGVGSAEGFADLEELAALLGAAIGVSRAVTSAGWRPHTEQVGQTGVRIAPDLYIAAGISGAIQHIVGCKAAKRILAINTDREAPIMGRATYAVIGDLHKVVPAISAEVRRARGL